MRHSLTHQLLVRRWRLAAYLQAARSGRTVGQLLEHLEVSRATLYRDLDFLRDANVAIAVETVNGEARYRLLGDVPQVGAGPLRGLALDLAIAALAPLQGSKLVKELTRLRQDLPRERHESPIRAAEPPTPSADPEIVGVLERAFDAGREVEIDYRGARDRDSCPRRVRPQELQLVKGQLYLVRMDMDRGAQRTLKLSRIRKVQLGDIFDRSVLPGRVNEVVYPN